MGGEAAYLSLIARRRRPEPDRPRARRRARLVRTQELKRGAAAGRGAPVLHPRLRLRLHAARLDETFRYWPQEVLLEDAVRIVRRFRPQVVVCVFSGTPRDGHGQHQASGIVARRSVSSSRETRRRFRPRRARGSRPGSPPALYQTTRSSSTAKDDDRPADRRRSIRSDGPLVLPDRDGRAAASTARRTWARSRRRGPNEGRVGLDRPGGAGRGTADLFAGVDTRLALARAAPRPRRAGLEAGLARVAAAAREARSRLSTADLSGARCRPSRPSVADLRPRARLRSARARRTGRPRGPRR